MPRRRRHAHEKVPQLARIHAPIAEAVLAWPERACVNDVRCLPLSRQEVPGARHEPLFAPPAPRRLVLRSRCHRGSRPCPATTEPGARRQTAGPEAGSPEAPPLPPHPPTPAPAANPPPQKPAAQKPAAKPAAQPLKDPIVAPVNGQPVRLSVLEIVQQSLPPHFRLMLL